MPFTILSFVATWTGPNVENKIVKTVWFLFFNLSFQTLIAVSCQVANSNNNSYPSLKTNKIESFFDSQKMSAKVFKNCFSFNLVHASALYEYDYGVDCKSS
jgi:hypothetical protein